MIQGQKTRLRTFEEDDVELCWRWDNDWEVNRWIILRYPASLSDTREGILDMMKPDPNEKSFAIETLDGCMIGGAALCQISWEDRRAEVSIYIGDTSRWNQGLGTDATQTLVRFGFEEMNLNRIGLTVYADNARAIRCYEKLGFVREGLQRQTAYRDGQYVDSIMMSILREEYLRSAKEE